MLYGSLDGRGVWGRMNTCIYMAKSLHCSPEIITTLLIGYVVVQSLIRVQHFLTPWIAACQASLSFTNSPSLLKLASIELVIPFNHLLLCRPL